MNTPNTSHLANDPSQDSNDITETVRKILIVIGISLLLLIAWILLFSWFTQGNDSGRVGFWFRLCCINSFIGAVIIGIILVQKIAETNLSRPLTLGAWLFGLILPLLTVICGMVSGFSTFKTSTLLRAETNTAQEFREHQEPRITSGSWGDWVPGCRTPDRDGYGFGTIVPPDYIKHLPVTFSGIGRALYLVDACKFPTPQNFTASMMQADRVRDDYEMRTSLAVLVPDDFGKHSTFIWNDDPESVSVFYIRTANPRSIQIAYAQSDFSNKVATLKGKDSATFTVPGGRWKYMWMIPMRSQSEMASLQGKMIWPEGGDKDVIAQLGVLLDQDKEALRSAYRSLEKDVPPFGTYYSREDPSGDAEEDPRGILLSQPVTYRREDIAPGTVITLGVNCPDNVVLDTPAHVIVGFSW